MAWSVKHIITVFKGFDREAEKPLNGFLLISLVSIGIKTDVKETTLRQASPPSLPRDDHARHLL